MAKKPRVTLAQFSRYIKDVLINPHKHDFTFRFITVRADNQGPPFYIWVSKSNLCVNIDTNFIVGKVGVWLEEHIEINDKYKDFTDDQKLKAAVSYWSKVAPPHPFFPKPVVFNSDKNRCYHRLSFDPTEGIESYDALRVVAPAWTEFLFRTNDPDALLMFIWSLFAKEADKSQYCWLAGGGQDSKSVVVDTIMRVLGPASCTGSMEDLKDGKNFTWMLVGKKLCYVSEADPWFPKSSKFKSYTGETRMAVERKYHDKAMADIHAKFLFTSNDKLKISSSVADTRRAIPIWVTPYNGDLVPDLEIKAKFYNELPAVLGFAKYLYEKNVRHKIPVKESNIKELADETEEHAIELFEQNFQPASPKHALKASAVTRILKECDIWKQEHRRRIMQVWSRRFKWPAESESRKIDGHWIRVFVGFQTKNTRRFETNLSLDS